MTRSGYSKSGVTEMLLAHCNAFKSLRYIKLVAFLLNQFRGQWSFLDFVRSITLEKNIKIFENVQILGILKMLFFLHYIIVYM